MLVETSRSALLIRAIVVLGLILAIPAETKAQTPAPPAQTEGAETKPANPNESLTEQLKENQGVLKPSTGIDDEMTVAPPDNAARTPIIKPPAPGEAAPVQPK